MAVIASIAAIAPGVAAAQSPFEGRTVRIIINLSPGGATGLQAQLFANFWQKHMEGNPNFVVEAVTGGAALQGINYVINSAQPDGLTVGWVTTSAAIRAVGPEEQRVDWSQVADTVIAGVGSPYVAYGRNDIAPGIETAKDFGDASDVVLGGTRGTSITSVLAMMGLELLDTPYRYVQGYEGGAEVNAAVLRNEVNFGVTPPDNYFGSIEQNLVDAGEGLGLWYYAATDENGRIRDVPALEGIAPFDVVYHDIKGEYPSGVDWEALDWVASSADRLTWMIMAPPDTPAELVALLREGFNGVIHDPEYIAAATAATGAMPSFSTPEETRAIIDGIMNVEPEVFEAARRIIDLSSQ